MKNLLPILSILLWMVAGPVGCSKSKEHIGWHDDSATGSQIEPLMVEDDLAVDANADVVLGRSSVTQASGRTHTIRRGDTLWAIAQSAYGSGNRWRDILAANPGITPRRLVVGKQVWLP